MPKVNLGFIGAGDFISGAHLPTALSSPIMQVRTIADLNQDLLNKHRRAIPSLRITRDYRDVLGDPEIDLVVIGTKQDLHARFIVESLDAGKWVYCEKPMAETPEEIEAVLSAEARNPGKLAIGLNRRFAPAYVRAKRLMQQTKRPWFINYRLMEPHLTTGEKDDFYRERPRIIYEGCHILDLACWFLDADPVRVYMSGDKYRNNCCILEFADGSNVSFMCGSIGSFCLWKEYMEVFSFAHSIAVSDFIDMRVRGFPEEYDRQLPLERNAHADAIARFGFDYYEICRVKEIRYNDESMKLLTESGMSIEEVNRNLTAEAQQAVDAYRELKPPYFNHPDKGRQQALEHFAQCLLDNMEPQTADGAAGARSTQLGLALLESLESHTAIHYPSVAPRVLQKDAT